MYILTPPPPPAVSLPIQRTFLKIKNIRCHIKIRYTATTKQTTWTITEFCNIPTIYILSAILVFLTNLDFKQDWHRGNVYINSMSLIYKTIYIIYKTNIKYIYIYIKLKTLFKAYIKKWVKPRNTLYLKLVHLLWTAQKVILCWLCYKV